MEKVELVMILTPVMGHLIPSLEMAKLMLVKNNQLSITAPIMKVPTDPEGTDKIRSLIAASNVEGLHFHHLPTPQDFSAWEHTSKGSFLYQLLDYQKPYMRDVASRIKGLSGFIIDLGSTTMMDIADELGVPTHLFVTSGAAFLGLALHFQTLEDEQNQEVSELVKAGTELDIPSFANKVPISVLPGLIANKEFWSTRFLKSTRVYRKVKAIMVNTFADLEPYAINSFSLDSCYGKSRLPPIYPIGPIVNRYQPKTQSTKDHSKLMNWLDCQPENSVVFLCFGSLGSLQLDQVQEIARGLEQSGYRFIWVLRRPPANKGGFASGYEDHGLVLPQGFLDRTASTGKVVGWVPQLAILSHPVVGGFVSHCGWNSTLESIFCGVPMATWPLAAEQQLNAFQLVKELKMAVEISLDYKESKENQATVRAEQIEKAIRELMDGENEVRRKVKEFSEKSKLAICEGGSSYLAWKNIMQSISFKS